MHKIFDTPGPISLYVEMGSGDLSLRAESVTETTVDVDGKDAHNVIVEQRGGQVVVLARHNKGGFFGTSSDLAVRVVLPSDSDLATKLGSADLVAAGRYGGARIKSGSGDVHIEELGSEAVVETGSGDISIAAALGHLRVKSGSGDVEARRVVKNAVISTGSGDVSLGTTEHEAVVKSGSGNVQVKDAHTDLAVSTASGNLAVGSIRRGTVKAKAVSGDVSVGVPAGIPVWTDISCVSGRVSSTLEGAGEPEKGQDFVEIRATTVTGDIRLEQM